MTPLGAPATLVRGVVAALGLDLSEGVPVVERARPLPGQARADWVSSVALRLSRGGEAAGVLAERIAARLDGEPGVRAGVAGRGLVRLVLDDAVLADLLRALPDDWAAPLGRVTLPGERRRSLDDPGYRAMLAHARLCRPGAGVGGPAYVAVPHDLLVLGADAHRVVDTGRAHHLVDWITATGAAVVTWTQDTDVRTCDPDAVAGLRSALASALRAAGLTPTERF